MTLCAGGVEATPRYFFMIGSVDSFERKLDDAQKELGLTSTAYVPVKYTNEVHSMLRNGVCSMQGTHRFVAHWTTACALLHNTYGCQVHRTTSAA